jgi:Spy/CpxP family protein refolding chaperone
MLVFALGAISWAATGDTAADQAAPAAGAPNGLGFGMFGGGGPEGEFAYFGGGMRGGGMRGGGEITDEMRARMEERRAAHEAQRDAFLDLVREKMSAEDQASLDELLGTAETQREALEQARDALHGTTSQIRDLIGKYFPLEGTAGDTSTTTAPAADGAGL